MRTRELPARVAAAALLGLGLALALAAPSAAAEDLSRGAWQLPPPGSCQARSGLHRAPGGEAKEPGGLFPFSPGDRVPWDRLESLRAWLPDFLWRYRERFFFEGMALEIGPCFRDYSPPAFFREATEANRGRTRLTEEGGLEGYGAGLPFPPDTIAPDDPRAGLKWLWNVEYRYQAAGMRGPFRMTDLVGRVGRAEPFEGTIFKIFLSHRADRPPPDRADRLAKGRLFAAGGLFFRPFDAREFAWRQFRSLATEREARRSDDLFAYLPQWRRVRRLNANRVEGIFMPSFSVGVQPAETLAVGGASGLEGAGSMAGGAGVGPGVSTLRTKRSGWEGLELRPLLHSARVLGVQDVLAPLNAVRPAYPEEPDRNFGPWGLSWASDRWDLRRALVLELRARPGAGSEIAPREILYVDLQTLQPLYLASFDAEGEMTNVGMYVGRWSEDRPDYPRWPDDPKRPVRVIDSVGAAFANLAEAGSWRRESWTIVGTPPRDRELRRLLSVNQLTKRR